MCLTCMSGKIKYKLMASVENCLYTQYEETRFNIHIYIRIYVYHIITTEKVPFCCTKFADEEHSDIWDSLF